MNEFRSAMAGVSVPMNKPAVWFPDTSGLVTLAVHAPLQEAVRTVLATHRRVLVAAVVSELEGLAAAGRQAAKWARIALDQLDWLGEPVGLDDPAGADLAIEIQEELAAGRPLRHPAEHFGEAAILALACRARTVKPILLSDDYDARVAAHARGIASYSTHRLLSLMIRQSKVTAVQAGEFASVLFTAGRAQEYTADELASGALGRVGRP